MPRNIPRNVVLIALGISLAAACSASGGGSVFTSSSTGDSGGNDQGAGGATGMGAGTTGKGAGGGFTITTGTNTGGGSSSVCNNDPNIDGDNDGWTGAEGDCNDCDPNVNPGAIEVIATADADGGIPAPADEDCDGTVDNAPEPCDTGLALDDGDPKSAAKAVELCKFTVANPGNKNQKTWGVIESQYVRADGSPFVAGPQVGLQPGFGPNVHPQGGSKLFALSSGFARVPGQPNACNGYSCSTTGPGTPPGGFPQDVANCLGGTNINDDIALQVRIRTPTNATGYSFDFAFFSFEYPEFVCTTFNDQFISLVSPAPTGSVNGNISFDSAHNPVSVNVAFFNVCSGCPLGTNDLTGNGFDGSWGQDAGATGWLTSQAPVTGGQEITIRWTIWDTGDSAWDSTALVDNFKWIANGGTVVVGTDPIKQPQ